MIAYVRGMLQEIEHDSVIIDVGGIGYQVFTPIGEEILRRGIGSEIILHTYFCVREDAQILYGFLQKDTLKLFRQLINVNGVGPKYAMAILATLNADAVIWSIASGDYKSLTKVPGIGAKTAQRIVLDLKDKVVSTFTPDDPAAEKLLGEGRGETPSKGSSAAEEAISALVDSLGFSRKEAQSAIERAYKEGMSAEELINAAFRYL